MIFQKSIFILLAVLIWTGLIYSGQLYDLQLEQLDKKTLKGLPFASFNDNNTNLYQSSLPPIEQYLNRLQFKHLLTRKEEDKYRHRLDKLLKDREFIDQFKMDTNARGWAGKGVREQAAFAMGEYYFRNWTPFKVGPPRINLGTSFFNTLENIFTARIPIISIPFKTPYKTVKDAEQSYRYYLKRYPDGHYVVPALFGIARCRIHQKDYLEAYVAYQYVLRFLMEKNGFTNSRVTDDLAAKLLHYTREYEDSINVNFQISGIGSSSHINSIFEFNEQQKLINITVSYGQYIDLFSSGSNN